jgi:hypothetical protein
MTQIPSSTPAPSEEERPHKPADDREEVYFEGSPLLRGEIGKVAAHTIIGIGLIALVVMLRDKVPWWAMLIGVLVAVVVVGWPVVIARSIKYRITNYRIDYEHGLLSKEIDTLELWHVEDIHFHQSVIDRLLNVGRITVMSHDRTTPKQPMWGLPNPRELFQSLKQQIIAVKRQRGVIKMDTVEIDTDHHH